MLYYPVRIEGLENLPAADQPAVYVSNHQSFLVCTSQRPRPPALRHRCSPRVDCPAAGAGSQCQHHRLRDGACTVRCCATARCPAMQDIYTLFHLHRDFKFISKTSNFLIPIIGWSMFLTGAHPPGQRSSWVARALWWERIGLRWCRALAGVTTAHAVQAT